MLVTQQIRNKIHAQALGSLFSSREFLALGNRAIVDKTLSRMVKNNEIERAARGLFFRPKQNRFIGKVPIDIETVVRTISQQNGETVQRHGAEAARLFKLSTQMPVKHIFYTNGTTRKIRIGNQEVQMLHTSNQRKLQHAGTNIGLAISALWYLGKNLVTPDVILKIQHFLSEEEFTTLKRANLAGWMHKAIQQADLIGTE